MRRMGGAWRPEELGPNAVQGSDRLLRPQCDRMEIRVRCQGNCVVEVRLGRANAKAGQKPTIQTAIMRPVESGGGHSSETLIPVHPLAKSIYVTVENKNARHAGIVTVDYRVGYFEQQRPGTTTGAG